MWQPGFLLGDEAPGFTQLEKTASGFYHQCSPHAAYIKMEAKRPCQRKPPPALSACSQTRGDLAYPKSYRPSEALSLPVPSRATKTLLSWGSFPGDVSGTSPPGTDRQIDPGSATRSREPSSVLCVLGKVNTQPKYPSCREA